MLKNNNKSLNGQTGFDTVRIQALADGIFAFAMTLLVIDMKNIAPLDESFWLLMGHLGQKLLYYLLSFLILGLFWTGHQAEFKYIIKTDRMHLWLNILLLMWVATISFSASLLAGDKHKLFSVVVYSCSITFTTAAYLLHWHYASYKNRLTVNTLSITIIRDIKKRLIVSNLLSVIALGFSLWNSTISIIVYLLIQLFFIFLTTRTKTGVPKNSE